MHLRLIIAACLAGSAFGCATDASQNADAAAARGPGDYRTGSRLPTYEAPATSATTREISKDDWIDDRRTGGMQGNWK